jgi:hypothetical protein
MDAWSTRFKSTWLDSRDACVALDEKLAKLVGGHWSMRGQNASPVAVLPLRCEAMSDGLRTLGMSPSSSIHCTILLALLGELLLCAEDGGILRKDTVARFAGSEPERAAVGEALRLMRNAVCHPASTSDYDEETSIASFADFVMANFKEETWASSLKARPGDLGKREVTFFALRLIEQLGWERAGRSSVKLKGAKCPHGR